MLSSLGDDIVGILSRQTGNALQPVPLVNLSSTCHDLRASLTPVLKELQAQHDAAWTMCDEMRTTFAQLAAAIKLRWTRNVRNSDLRVLSSLIRTGAVNGGQLRSIDFASGSIRDDGAVVVAELIQQGYLKGLQRLRLAGNEIGDRGAAALATALGAGTTPTLVECDLSANPVGDGAAPAFAKVVERGALDGLQMLDLSYCHLSSMAVNYLRAAHCKALDAHDRGTKQDLLDIALNSQSRGHGMLSMDDDSDSYSTSNSDSLHGSDDDDDDDDDDDSDDGSDSDGSSVPGGYFYGHGIGGNHGSDDTDDDSDDDDSDDSDRDRADNSHHVPSSNYDSDSDRSFSDNPSHYARLASAARKAP